MGMDLRAALTCNGCWTEFTPHMDVRGLTICPHCRRCVVVADGRVARLTETSTIGNFELTALRRERLRIEAKR